MNKTAFSIISRYKLLLTKKRRQFQELGECITELEQRNDPSEASTKLRLAKKQTEMAGEIEEIKNFLNELKQRYKLV